MITSTLDGIDSGGSKMEKCLQNHALLNRPLDQKLNDLDQARQNSYEKYDVKQIRTTFVAQIFRDRADLESSKSRTSEAQQLIRE